MAKPIKIKIIGDAKSFDSTMTGVSGKLGKLGTTAAVAGAAVAAALGAAAVKFGGDFDKAYDAIRVGTGATGADLEKLKGVMQDVASDVPSSMGDAGTAVADLNTRLGLTGENLEAMAEQQLNLARLTGSDLASQIKNTSRIFGDWGISTEGQAGALDRLYQVAQTTGITVDQLSTVTTNFGAPMRALGFDFETATALMGKFEKEGVNTEAVLAGMKVGLGKMAKEGEQPIETFQRLQEDIANAATEGEAFGIAAEAFGTRAGPDMAMAIREGRFEVDELLATMSTDTIAAAARDTESWGEKWQMIKNRVLIKLEPIIMKIFNGLGGLVEKLEPLFKTIEWGVVAMMAGFQSGEEGGEGFLGMMQTIGAKVAYWWPIIKDTIANTIEVIKWIVLGAVTVIQDFWEEHGEQITETVQSFMSAVQAIFYTVVGIIQDLWEDYGDDLIKTVTALWANVQDIIGGALSVVKGIFDFFAALFKGDWEGMWNAVKTVFSGVWNALGGIVRGALDVVKLLVVIAVDKIKDALLGIGRALGDMARDVWNKGFEVGRNIMNGIKDGVAGAVGFVGDIGKSIYNALAGFVNDNIINKINRSLEFRIEIFGRGIDINPPDIPRVPTLRAMGGPAHGLTMVGERGPEMVHLPRGSNVVPNHAGVSAAGGITVNVASNADPHAIAREISWAMKTSGR